MSMQNQEEKIMVQNIFIVAMVIVAIAAVGFGWWLDRGGAGRNQADSQDGAGETKKAKDKKK